jgi:hypothetical protein
MQEPPHRRLNRQSSKEALGPADPSAIMVEKLPVKNLVQILVRHLESHIVR